MYDKARRGISPLRNFWTWLNLIRNVRRYNAVVALGIESDASTETAIFGNHVYPSNWSHNIPAEQRKYYWRLDTRFYRTIYGVVATGFPSWDSGVRFAWREEDAWTTWSTNDEILAVDLRTGRVYSPPRNKLIAWSDPKFVSAYLALDEAGWREWSEADEQCVKERVANAHA